MRGVLLYVLNAELFLAFDFELLVLLQTHDSELCILNFEL